MKPYEFAKAREKLIKSKKSQEAFVAFAGTANNPELGKTANIFLQSGCQINLTARSDLLENNYYWDVISVRVLNQ